ncbi:MAG: hypothetical protein J6L76_07105 [Clostridia bacterium]|nr:hypothetical protein [Clostridia bacterium]
MTKKRSTKSTLVMSALALVMCISLLVGSTFAWFTDEVSSTGNKIEAGTLYIDMLVMDADGEYESIKASKAPVFNYDKWEPGYTKAVNVKVVNNGTLALQYSLQIITAQAMDDADFLLSDVIDVYYASEEVAVDTRDAFNAAVENEDLKLVGTLTDVIMGGSMVQDTLLAKDEADFATIVLKMQESAGNDYQGLSVGGTFDLKLFATQFTYEKDSFDELYDKDAVIVANAEDLKEALAEGGVISMVDDIMLADAPIVLAKDTIIDLNGHTLAATSTSTTTSNLITVETGKTLALTNGTVTFEAENPDLDWGGEGQKPYPGYANNTISCKGKLIIDGATIVNTTPKGGASYAIDCYPGADLIINDGIIDGGEKIAIRMFANSDTIPTNVTINGGTIKGYRAVWVQLPGSNPASVKLANLTVNGGTLISTETVYNQVIYSYSYGDSFSGTTIALNGGIYEGDVALHGGGLNGVKYGEENITVDAENCQFKGAYGVYSYNEDSTVDTIVAPNA